ncbi:MAG: AAA family ATPase [Deltaproteobacteria bacterium]|jgi:CO dehydrogenase maturation factor|nr:AAA family ATPase [Deltaproteobacteria bacterium]
MSMIIGMAGKGGTGKTTLAGLAVRYLAKIGKVPILAVDADSNANLADVLGMTYDHTLSEAREEMKSSVGNVSITKDTLIEMRTQEAIVEGDDFDLVVMGQPEGSGCYCAANSILAAVLEKTLDNYPYQVIDNEAGMEHISRLTARYMDIFFVISDASRRGLTAALRIWKLVDELKIRIKHKYLIVNRVRGDLSDEVKGIIQKENMELAGVIPDDSVIYDTDQNGEPTSFLKDSPAVKAALDIFQKTLVEDKAA